MVCMHLIAWATLIGFENDIVGWAVVVDAAVAAESSVVDADSNHFDKHRMCDQCYYSTMMMVEVEVGEVASALVRSIRLHAY